MREGEHGLAYAGAALDIEPGHDRAIQLLLHYGQALGAPPDLFAKEIPLGRYGDPDDVAEVVALLASDRGKWMTGGNIHVDGGMTAR